MKIDFDGLLEVAKCTREAEPEEFDMSVWLNKGCGTLACAIGHFVMKHPDDPLKIVNNRPEVVIPGISRYDSIYAVEYRFGLDLNDVDDLFVNSDHVDDDQEKVAQRIENFVKEKRTV